MKLRGERVLAGRHSLLRHLQEAVKSRHRPNHRALAPAASHHTGQEDHFNIRRPDEIIKAQIETSHTLESCLISIASHCTGGRGIGA